MWSIEFRLENLRFDLTESGVDIIALIILGLTFME